MPDQQSVSAGIDSDRVERRLELLLTSEDLVRGADDENELAHTIVNETRRLVGARQVVLFRQNASGRFRVVSISSVALVDSDTPFVRWVEAMVRNIEGEQGLEKPVQFELPGFSDPLAPEAKNYPFGHFLWQPFQLRNGEIFAGLLIARERHWNESEAKLLSREAAVFATVWQSLHGTAKLARPRRFGLLLKALTMITLFAIACIPVPMSTLAPVEVVAAKPHRVTAPIAGVVSDLPVDPNTPVKSGDILMRFDDTSASNRLAIAERKMKVAQARFDRAYQAAFTDEGSRHDLAIAANEFQLRRAERDFAKAQFGLTVVRAQRDGVLIYTDKDHWLGRPVKIGERLMEIADPAQTMARIDLPVADAIVLDNGADVRLYLDADPLRSVPARLERKAYHADPNSSQQLVYRLFAAIGKSEKNGPPIRIGSRGTAQLFGDQVPLIYFLLRRPISVVRQYLGF